MMNLRTKGVSQYTWRLPFYVKQRGSKDKTFCIQDVDMEISNDNCASVQSSQNHFVQYVTTSNERTGEDNHFGQLYLYFYKDRILSRSFELERIRFS
jgi:hypothetical protein